MSPDPWAQLIMVLVPAAEVVFVLIKNPTMKKAKMNNIIPKDLRLKVLI
jgi:hypothetical protein